jgi:predicted TIM-barrel fold metal-dependent hydrolase
MAGAAELAASCPRVTFVLQHAGMLEDRSPAGRAAWRAGMALLAAQRNVVAKLSGFGTFIHRNDPDHIGWLIGETVGLFGADRCLWGSNFPIEKLWTSYGALLDAHRRGAGGLSAADQEAIFCNTARRVYRL